ncbi:MAG: hypothetical protein FWF24_04835 [Alphaproteobacteria bacterium]|nr:hypothetical protein [Alphaproteobacteria bacterium]
MFSRTKTACEVQLTLKDGRKQKQCLSGRELWALRNLDKAGAVGCTPLHNPAPRWAAYVHDLRGRGFHIDTITEPHGGLYAGTHARYVLRSRVRFIEEGGAS